DAVEHLVHDVGGKARVAQGATHFCAGMRTAGETIPGAGATAAELVGVLERGEARCVDGHANGECFGEDGFLGEFEWRCVVVELNAPEGAAAGDFLENGDLHGRHRWRVDGCIPVAPGRMMGKSARVCQPYSRQREIDDAKEQTWRFGTGVDRDGVWRMGDWRRGLGVRLGPPG